MTISTENNRISYTGNGVSTVYAFPYYFLANSDIDVYVDGVQQTETTNYTLTGAGNSSGGTITFLVAPANGLAVVINRYPDLLQSTSIPANDPLPAKSLERMVDKAMLGLQRVSDQIKRSLRLADSDSYNGSTTIPTPVGGSIFTWSSDGTQIEYKTVQDLATVATYGTAQADVFDGDGVWTTKNLSFNPGSLFNIDVSINGVTKLPTTDYQWTSGVAITFTVAPPAASKVLVRYQQGLPSSIAQIASAIATSASAYWSTVQGFINKLVSSSGSVAIGFINTLSGSVARTVSARLNDTVRVNDFVTGGLGTEASPWTGWDTGITWAPVTTYYFNDGHYSYATSPNFAHVHLKLAGSHATVIHHTGSGYAMVFDAGVTTGECVGLDICLRVEGNASSTGGVLQRGCSRSKFDMSFRNIPGTCFEEQTGILNTYYLEHTAFVYGESIQPDRLLNVSRRGVGQESSANVYYLRAENCTSTGVNLSYCLNSVFISGTSEANGGGIYIETSSAYNTFINNDFEINSGLDIECRGSHNTFINCLSTTTAQIQGLMNSVIGGTYNTLRAWGDKNHFDKCMYSNNGGAFDVSGGTNYTKKSVYNANTASLDLDVLPATASFKSGSGSVSATNATATTLFTTTGTGMWQVFCYINSADAANFTASATVLQESGGTARITSNNGGLLTLTLSGLNVRATQTSGGTATIVYSYHRIN